MPDEPRTALGSAHERFLRSLPDRGRELRELAGKLQSEPGDERVVEQIGRRLHALYASAQVFQEQPLLRAIKASLGGMETARLERRPPTPGELDTTLALCEWLAGGAAVEADDALRSIPAPRGRVSEPNLGGGARIGARALNASDRAADDGIAPALRGGAMSVRSERPVSISQTVAGALTAPEVIAVLVVAGPEVEREVRAALPEEHCELTSSPEVEIALSVIDEVAPDVVLVETAQFGVEAGALVRRLRGARAGGVRAVVAIVHEDATDVEALLGRAHVDAVLRLPLPKSGLLDRLLRWSGRGARAGGGLDAISAGTVDEIARGVAEEIRRGIAGSLRLGRAERIDLGDKSELLAATWSAVARIRQHLAGRADGRVRFDEAPFAGGPAALALTEREAAERYVGLSDALRGKRILVADDDAAVLWFFAGLMREAGAIAIEAHDGREALEYARDKPPDVVISDILMPEIDGFTLCRELRRDLSLAHVPVILLSWKEDFLQRMRELDAGAVGYLRKEAGSHQIIATVSEALRPRTDLAGLLARGGEVHGRIELLGVPVLLQTVAALRPDARVTVHDAWNLFDVDIRGGATLAVTRTASDGSFARGVLALRQLLGVDSGRFTVTLAQGQARTSLPESLEQLIGEGLRQLGAVLDAVSDSRLMRVCRVALDDEILGPLLTATPTALADLAARLRAGEPARELVLNGAVTARDLEQHLRELARRGAVRGVFGADGEDLVEAARLAREQQPGELLHAGERPRPSPLPVLLGEADVEWMDTPARAPDADAVPGSSLAAPIPGAAAPARGAATAIEAVRAQHVVELAPFAAASVQQPAGRAEGLRRNTPPLPALEPYPPADAPASTDAAIDGTAPALRGGAASSPAGAFASAEVTAPADHAPPRADASTSAEPRQRRHAVALGPALAAEQTRGEPFAVRSSLLHAEERPAPAQAQPSAAADTPARGDRAATDAEWLKLAAVLAALMFVGFAGWRIVQSRAPMAQPAPARVATTIAPAPPARPEPAVQIDAAGTSAGSAGIGGASASVGQELGYGRALPFIDRSRGVRVAADQGLLVVEYEAVGPPPRVRVGGRDLGAAPVAAALPAGRHEIVLKGDEQTSFRYVMIRAGETRVVQVRD